MRGCRLGGKLHIGNHHLQLLEHRQNSQKNQQRLTRSEIREFWPFYNGLIHKELQNCLSENPFAEGVFEDLGSFTMPRRKDHRAI